jgi:hypothetical protein
LLAFDIDVFVFDWELQDEFCYIVASVWEMTVQNHKNDLRSPFMIYRYYSMMTRTASRPIIRGVIFDMGIALRFKCS